MGGLAQMAGMAAQLSKHMAHLVATETKYAPLRALTLGIVRSPHKSAHWRQCLAWQGAAHFASLDVLPSHSLTKSELDSPRECWW